MPPTIIFLLFIVLIIAIAKIYTLKKELLALEREAEEERKIFSSIDIYNQKQKEIKNQNKAKVMALLESKEKLTNKIVAEHLNISNATAFRYLEELEIEGMIKQKHSFGRFVYYVKS